MLTAILASTGGQVLIPDAVEVLPADNETLVNFVDSSGRILVTFRRADVSLYLKEGSSFGWLALPMDGKQPQSPADE